MIMTLKKSEGYKMISSNSYEVLSEIYHEDYEITGKKKYLVYLGLVKLLKETGYFNNAYIFQSHGRLAIKGHAMYQLQEHETLSFIVSESASRCDVTVWGLINEMNRTIHESTFEIGDLRLFQYKFLLFLQQYIKQTEEYRKIDINAYLNKDFPVKVD
jgi:hypothetical protein